MTKKTKKTTAKDQIPYWEKPWNERSLYEKFKLVIKHKMMSILLFTFPFYIFCTIMAIISQKWEIFAVQSVCYLLFAFGLYRIHTPPKFQTGGVPYFFITCLLALIIILITQYYF